jgi:hypothetical protein
MTWTMAILISAVVLLTAAGFMLRRQRLDTLVFRAGRIRLVRSHSRMRQSRRICDAKPGILLIAPGFISRSAGS